MGVFRNSALGVYLFLDGNENKIDISIVGTNGNFFLINAHGVLRRMGAATEIPGRKLFIIHIASHIKTLSKICI